MLLSSIFSFCISTFFLRFSRRQKSPQPQPTTAWIIEARRLLQGGTCPPPIPTTAPIPWQNLWKSMTESGTPRDSILAFWFQQLARERELNCKLKDRTQGLQTQISLTPIVILVLIGGIAITNTEIFRNMITYHFWVLPLAFSFWFTSWLISKKLYQRAISQVHPWQETMTWIGAIGSWLVAGLGVRAALVKSASVRPQGKLTETFCEHVELYLLKSAEQGTQARQIIESYTKELDSKIQEAIVSSSSQLEKMSFAPLFLGGGGSMAVILTGIILTVAKNF